TALETAIALAACGAKVTLSYRKKEFARPKPENVEKLNRLVQNPSSPVQIERPTSERVTTAASSEMRGDKPAGFVRLLLGSTVGRIEPDSVMLKTPEELKIPNDVVFTMLGREAPLDFFRRSGIGVRGEWTWKTWAGFLAFFAFCWFLYLWKAG